jgi:hypothetical protein
MNERGQIFWALAAKCHSQTSVPASPALPPYRTRGSYDSAPASPSLTLGDCDHIRHDTEAGRDRGSLPALGEIGGWDGFAVGPQPANNGACNVSHLCQLANGAGCTSGFVIQAGAPRWVLIRAVGVSLAGFGVSPTVASPAFILYDSARSEVGISSMWSNDPILVGSYSTIFSLVGAFPLRAGSDEGLLMVPLNPGAYTAVFKGASAGTILGEVYLLPF